MILFNLIHSGLNETGTRCIFFWNKEDKLYLATRDFKPLWQVL